MTKGMENFLSELKERQATEEELKEVQAILGSYLQRVMNFEDVHMLELESSITQTLSFDIQEATIGQMIREYGKDDPRLGILAECLYSQTYGN